jgi:predicted nuclease of predicted toxin-antitoxin system
MSRRLWLDEHFRAEVAKSLRQRGYDVAAIQEQPDWLGASDAELCAYAAADGLRVVTENAPDFIPLLRQTVESGRPAAPLLLTSAHRFPRRKAATGQLTAALAAWLDRPDHPRPLEDWLT